MQRKLLCVVASISVIVRAVRLVAISHFLIKTIREITTLVTLARNDDILTFNLMQSIKSRTPQYTKHTRSNTPPTYMPQPMRVAHKSFC